MGGTSGMGLELAKLYHESGYVVTVASRKGEQFFASELAKKINFFPVDVTSEQSVREFFSHLKEKKINFDIYLHCAGIGTPVKTKIPDFKISRQIIEVNVVGYLNCLECVVPYFIERNGGHLVVLSSVSGMNGTPGVAAYAGSKAAVWRMSETLGIDLKKYHIDVTTILPGYVQTGHTKSNKHWMPFSITAVEAAKKIKWAIEKKKILYGFPAPMNAICYTLMLLPRQIYVKIIEKVFNHSF
jgi:short-subunit dehydrogenase